MIKRRLYFNGRAGENAAAAATMPSALVRDEEVEWEMRPGGMLVQKRGQNVDDPAPSLRVRVAYGALRYEISVNSRATFGELKKLLTAETGLQPGEQKLIYRGKDRENGQYLDICGVKDRAKVILMEDSGSKERRIIEMRKNARIQTVQRAIAEVSMDVEKLAEQVSAIEKSIANGNKGKRVQKCVETLDLLKVSNAGIKPVIVTTKWETFDPPATAHWEFFD
ncbi:hypothetical protein RJ640_015919 [Escallonia rubra]|uniref:Ubiquitin-like domain-containing protein n=1 Tax=Escallonia rubra TaxID=112253 RepID=A0AA88UD95_9ASTE|nr:hypothetical protein RJ640_015919 [Escallonia rubra]